METKPSWQLVWEKGFQPQFSTEALESLALALETDDPRLTQVVTTSPPPQLAVYDWECEAACAVGFCVTVDGEGFGKATVEQVVNRFASALLEADDLCGEPAASRHFLRFWDETVRHTAFPQLLAVIRKELENRKKQAA